MKEVFSISLDPEIVARIDELIGRASRSAWIETAIKAELKRQNR